MQWHFLRLYSDPRKCQRQLGSLCDCRQHIERWRTGNGFEYAFVIFAFWEGICIYTLLYRQSFYTHTTVIPLIVKTLVTVFVSDWNICFSFTIGERENKGSTRGFLVPSEALGQLIAVTAAQAAMLTWNKLKSQTTNREMQMFTSVWRGFPVAHRASVFALRVICYVIAISVVRLH